MRFIGAATGTAEADATVTAPNSPIGKMDELFGKNRVHVKHERFFVHDHLTRYERGMAFLEERMPPQHEKLEDVSALCIRLRENIRRARRSGDIAERGAERHEILITLNGYCVEIIQITFDRLCGIRESEGQDSVEMPALPTKVREVADWFRRLSLLERCFAIAVCVLQGAPSQHVSRAANELCVLLERSARRVAEAAQAQGDGKQPSEGTSQAFVSVEELLEHTHIVSERYDGAERMRWEDDAFASIMEEFLARQATMVGMLFDGRSLLEILQDWATSDNEERSWRAARLLARIWWRTDSKELFDLADEWAKSDDMQTWQSAAALLYGAYVAERDGANTSERDGANTAERAEPVTLDVSNSETLRHLRGWADWTNDAEFACVAAYAYGLIGHQSPTVALDGLDHLLRLGKAWAALNGGAPTQRAPFNVVAFAVLSYAELAASGHVRDVLARFAQHAEYYGRSLRSTGSLLELERSRRAREQGLDIIFFQFVFLVALSLSGVRRDTHAAYSLHAALSSSPDMPNARGQDVLLAGILAEPEGEWRSNLRTLLCAAISDGWESLAFDVLRWWADIALYLPGSQPTARLRQFILDLYEQLRRWDRAFGKSGLRTGSELLAQRLHQWTLPSRQDLLPLRHFAEATLRVLNTN